jgi:hypothetical protein
MKLTKSRRKIRELPIDVFPLLQQKRKKRKKIVELGGLGFKVEWLVCSKKSNLPCFDSQAICVVFHCTILHGNV